MRRACVLGQGSIGRRHGGLLRELGLTVTAYDPAANGQWPDGVRRAASEHEALSAADVAIVASPSSEHVRHARMALDAGVPVLVEKPLALDARSAVELQSMSEAAGVPLGVAMNLRFHPAVLELRALLPRVGTVRRAAVWCGTWLPGWRPGVDYRRTYSAQRALGGGVLLDAIHELDYLTWLLGPARSVRATLAKISELELDVEDVALLTLEMSAGALATVSLDYLDHAYHRGCRLVGDSGTLAWDWSAERVTLWTAEGERLDVAAPADAAATYARELHAFIAAVRDGTAPPVGAGEAVRTLAIVDAARKSAADQGIRVPLDATFA
jgi:predicted dehydrogenase